MVKILIRLNHECISDINCGTTKLTNITIEAAEKSFSTNSRSATEEKAISLKKEMVHRAF